MFVIEVGSVEPVQYLAGFHSFEEGHKYLEETGWKLISPSHHVFGLVVEGKLLQAQVVMLPPLLSLDELPRR